MKHLTVDEMIDFVSFNKLDNESLALAAKVNAHIFECADCRKKISAFQTVYDELIKMGEKENISELVGKRFEEKEKKKKNVRQNLNGLM